MLNYFAKYERDGVVMASDDISCNILRAVGDEALGFRVSEIRDLPDVSGRMWRIEFAQN